MTQSRPYTHSIRTARSLTRAARLLWFALAACLFLAPCPRSFGQAAAPAPLTLEQAIAIARSRNPNLLSAEQNLFSVKAQEMQAGVRENPYFTVYGANLTNPAYSTTPYSYSLQASRLFERGQKRRWRLDSARSTTEQTAAQLHDQQRQIVLLVKQAFTTMLQAKSGLKIAEDNLADFTRELNINQERYKAGDIGKLDYERLDLQLAQYESDASTAKTNLGQSSYQLQTLLGYKKLSDHFDIVGDMAPPVVTESRDALEQKALLARPDYLAAQSSVRVAEADVKLAYANGTSDPTLEGEYDHSGTLSSYGFYISVPVRIFDRNQGNKATSKYTAQASRFAEIAARNQVYSDVDQAWVGYVNAKILSDRYNGHYLAEAKDVLSIAQFAYEHGGLALIDYLNALQDSRTTQFAALNAYAQTWMAIHQLSFVSATEVAR